MKTKLALLSFILSLTLSLPAAFAEIQTGSRAPEFSLQDINGQSRSLSEFSGKYVVLEWINHSCPFVVKHYNSGNMQNLQKTYTDKGVVWLSINSSAAGKQGNMSPEDWKKTQAEKNSAATGTLLDPDGTVGKLYGAQTTPHMYIVNPEGNLIYQGAIDSVESTDAADIPKSQNYVQSALDEAMSGKTVSTPSTKAYGCSVKY
jgi:hypothetical protein